MVTALDSLNTSIDYAEMARRPLEAEHCAMVGRSTFRKGCSPRFFRGINWCVIRNF
jgi:hypothetical protein